MSFKAQKEFERGQVTGAQLKMIALVTMLIDHIAAVFLWRSYEASYAITGSMQLSEALDDRWIVWVAEHQELVFTIYDYMRLIGRMAFPIYCFLIVEGFLHTKSVPKYAGRLFLFALISEIPFDLAISGRWWNTYYSNVFFTLVIGLLLIWGLSYVEAFYSFWMEKKWEAFLGQILAVLGGLILAVAAGGFAELVLKTDYGMMGVLAIGLMYLFRKTRALGFALAILLLSIDSNIEIVAMLMLIPLLRYNGERGKQNKYVFYGFYPIHLLLLALLCMAAGI